MPHLTEFFDAATHEGNLSRYAVPSLVVVHARSEGDAVEAAQAVLDDANVEGEAVGWSDDSEMSWAEAAEKALEAADRYVNWHESRIVPTLNVPDRDTALWKLREALVAAAESEPA